MLVDVAGGTPSHLIAALGKDGFAYLLDRDNLGGLSSPPVASAPVANSEIRQAAITYGTEQGTYVALRASGTMLTAFRIAAANPPAILKAWSVERSNGGCGSPFVTPTDGTSNMIVWVVGTEDPHHASGGDQRLHGYDGETGAVVYGGGGPNELMAGTHRYSTTGIAARGRIYVAGDNKVYAFAVPASSPSPTPSPTPTATVTPIVTPTPSATPTSTPTPTPTSTRTPTPTSRPIPTPRPRPAPRPRPTPH